MFSIDMAKSEEKLIPDRTIINIEIPCANCYKPFKTRLTFYFGDWLVCPFCCSDCRHEFFQKLNGERNYEHKT